MAENTNDQTIFAGFVANIEARISKLTTLEIKTIIGDYKVDPADTSITIKKDSAFKIMHSKIDLIQGDITTHVSEELTEPRYTWLREMHGQKEARGHEIIDGNIRAIMSLFDLYKRTKVVEIDEENLDETEIEPLAPPPSSKPAVG